jgi:hypothetical protein
MVVHLLITVVPAPISIGMNSGRTPMIFPAPDVGLDSRLRENDNG